MIVGGKKIARIAIKHGQSYIGILTDEEAKMAPGYTVEVALDTRPGENAIAFAGDVLYYEDVPDEKYIVTQADDKFFTMVPVTVDHEHEKVLYDNKHRRTYPNNIKVATLADYGLVLEFRGAEEDGSIEEN